MKTILGLLLVLISITAFGQVDKKPFTEVDEEEPTNSTPFKIHPKGIKLFGDIYFGMSKQELKKVLANNKENQIFKVLNYEIIPLPGQSKYSDNGLCELRMRNGGFHNPYLNEISCRQVLIAVDSIMSGLGAESIFKNTSWPNPLLMSGFIAKTYLLKGKIIDLWNSDYSYGLVYNVNIDITSKAWEDELIKMNKRDIKKNIHENKEKF